MADGEEVYDAIVALSPPMKVIFMSGYTGDAADFITKPLFPETLLKKVREVLDR
jgi:hypothetical protein